MDSITLLDLFVILAGSGGKGRQEGIDVLRSLYERTHSYYVAGLSGFLALTAGIFAALIGLLLQHDTTIAAVAIAIIGLAGSVAWVAFLAYRLRRLERDYLDVMQVYHLLARFF